MRGGITAVQHLDDAGFQMPAATSTAPTSETTISFSGAIGAQDKSDTGMAYGTGPAYTEPQVDLTVGSEQVDAAQALRDAPPATEAQAPVLNDAGELNSPVAQLEDATIEEAPIEYDTVEKRTALARQNLPRFLKVGEVTVGAIRIEILELLGNQSITSLEDVPQMPIFLFGEEVVENGRRKRPGHQLHLRVHVGEDADVLKNLKAWGEMLYTKLTAFFQSDALIQEHLGGKFKIVGSMFNPEQWLHDLAKSRGRMDVWANLNVLKGGTKSTPWTWFLRMPHVPASIVLEPAGLDVYKPAAKPNELHLSTVLQGKPYIVKVLLHKDVNLGQFFTVPGLIQAVVRACDTYLPMPSTWHHTKDKAFELLKPTYDAAFISELPVQALATETPVAEVTPNGATPDTPTEDFRSSTAESDIASKLKAE